MSDPKPEFDHLKIPPVLYYRAFSIDVTSHMTIYFRHLGVQLASQLWFYALLWVVLVVLAVTKASPSLGFLRLSLTEVLPRGS